MIDAKLAPLPILNRRQLRSLEWARSVLDRSTETATKAERHLLRMEVVLAFLRRGLPPPELASDEE